MAERFEATTTVRRPRVVLMWALVAAMVALGVGMTVLRHFFHEIQPIGPLPFWLLGPAIAAVQRRPKIETLAVSATPEGLVLGDKIVPRAKLTSAMLRREADRTWVLLRGGRSTQVDVEVPNDEDADRLCSALALDAKSTTAEFTLFGKARSTTRRMLALMAVAVAVGTFAIVANHAVIPFAVVALPLLLLLLVAGGVAMIYSRQTKLRVGADGIVVKQGFGKRQFVPHEEIASVETEGAQVVVTRKHGEALTFAVQNDVRKKQAEEIGRQAQSIAWRIEKAREAYRALAGNAPQAALALDRGQKTVREWIEQLRRVGEGANATFRDVGLTREQLLAVVESTTAAAKERLAAAVALRNGLTEEEKPRIRVAADRCVEPAMRERMVRVAFAPTEEEMIAALEAEEAISAAGDARR